MGRTYRPIAALAALAEPIDLPLRSVAQAASLQPPESFAWPAMTVWWRMQSA
jgi:hypothetical protein